MLGYFVSSIPNWALVVDYTLVRQKILTSIFNIRDY